MRRLSKSKMLSGWQCPRKLWLETYKPELAVEDPKAEARFATGNEVGALAREQFPGGVLVEHAREPSIAVTETQGLLASGTKTIFEAAFQARDVLIRADVVTLADKDLDVIEVKSSTGVKEYHYLDAAIQAWVLEEAGVAPKSIGVMVIDNTFVYAGDGRYEGLFKVEDVTEEAAALRPEVAALRDVLIKVVNQDEEPKIEPGVHCSSPFDCPFLDHCAPSDTPYPVLNLPRGGELKWSLYREGIRDLRDVPEERLKLDVHRLVVQQAKLGRAFIAEDLAAQLGPDALPYPRYYLDFETVQFGIPVWEGTSPYKQQAFQYSLHVEHAGGELQHHEFIDLTGEDPSRRLAEALLGVIGEEGPVIVYNRSLESGVLKSLAVRFPDLAPALGRIDARVVDLLPILRSGYYHPDMQGSWSIKAVLPTVEGMPSYDDLEGIKEGEAAMVAYHEATNAETPDARREQIRKELLEYCKLDTRAMVMLTRALSGRFDKV